MTLKMSIEPISENNFNDFLFLIEKLAEYEKLTPPDPEAKNRLKRDGLCENPKYRAYLGKYDDKYVGYIIYFTTYSSFLALPTLYLEDIFILSEYRMKGMGTEMFRFCISQAKSIGCGRIEFCVLDWNTPAQNFYNKLGASQLGWVFYRLDSRQLRIFIIS
jgi:GNAT superfamily N-acetyltransferase